MRAYGVGSNAPPHRCTRVSVKPASAKLFPALLRRLYRVIGFAYNYCRPQYDEFEVPCATVEPGRPAAAAERAL